MKLGIDAREVQTYPTGIGRYFQGLISGLFHLYPSDKVMIFINEDDSWIPHQIKKQWQVVSLRSRSKTPLQYLTLPRELGMHNLDLFVTNPFGVVPNLPLPYVLVILDLIFWNFPELASFKARLYERFLAKRAVQGAKLILTCSDYSAGDIVKYLKVEPVRIHKVYLGIEECFLRSRPQTEVERVLSLFSLSPPFMLYVGNRRPHKNLTFLLEVFKNLSLKLGNIGLRLVLVGDIDASGRDQDSENLIREIKRLDLEERVILLGRTSDKKLACLYQAAELLVHPSYFEGFGLTILEAMGMGCPVVCSDAASLPEVAGKAAVILSPFDKEEWVETILSLLKDKDRREEMSKLGLKHAQDFSWEKTAQETLKIIYETSNSS